MKLSYKILITIAITALLSSCKKDGNSSTDGKATITLKITQVLPDRAQVVKPFTIITNDSTHCFGIADTINGNTYVWPTALIYYASNFRLQDHDGNITAINLPNFLLDWSAQGIYRIALGKFDPKHYHEFLFDLGVDSGSTINAFTFDGKGDTSNTQQHWDQSIHYTMDKTWKQTISIAISLEAQPASNDTVAIFVNHSKLFKNINIRNENNTDLGSNPALELKLKANLPGMYSVGL